MRVDHGSHASSLWAGALLLLGAAALLAMFASAAGSGGGDDDVVTVIDAAFHHLGDNFVPTYQPQNTEGIVYEKDFTVTGTVENPAIKMWIRGQVPAYYLPEEDQVKLFLNGVLLGYLNEYAMGNGSIYATDDEVEIEVSIEEGVLHNGTNTLRLATGWGTRDYDRDDIMFWNIRLIRAKPIEVSCDLLAPSPGDDSLAMLDMTKVGVLVWNDRHVDAIQWVLVTVDPGGANVSFRWTQRTDTVALEPGARDHASFPGLWSGSSKDIVNRTWTIDASMMFKWSFPTEGPVDVRVTVRDDQTRMHTFTFKQVLTVRTRLVFSRPVKVVADGAGPVGDGSWVQGGTDLTIEVPPVVYAGSDGVRPPPGTLSIAVAWDGALVAQGDPPSGDAWVVHWVVPRTVRASSVLSVDPLVLADGARPPPDVDTELEVDGRGPEFVSVTPRNGTWLLDGQVEARAVLRDTGGSGVDLFRVQFQCKPAGARAWGDWQPVGVLSQGLGTGQGQGQGQGLGGGDAVVVAYVQLAEGWGHRLRFRAFDRVGNGPSVSPDVVLGVDATPVAIDRPGPEGWQRSREVVVRCSLADPDGGAVAGQGSGIDLGTVMVSTMVAGATDWGPWRPADDVTGLRSPSGAWSSAQASARVVLAEGPENYARWRATDVAGNAVVVSAPFQVRVDLSPPVLLGSWPQGTTFDRVGDVASVVTFGDGGGSGVDPARVEWAASGGENASFGDWSAATSVEVSAGAVRATARPPGMPRSHDNWVRWRAWDFAGNGPVEVGPFGLPVNLPPTAVIAAPAGGASFSSEEPLAMSAQGSSDPDPGDTLTCEWSSDLDGPLGFGPTLLHALTPGWHNVTLRVDDGLGGDHVATSTVRVRVVEPSHVREPFPTWLFLLVIAAVAAAVATWQAQRWRRRRLLEGT